MFTVILLSEPLPASITLYLLLLFIVADDSLLHPIHKINSGEITLIGQFVLLSNLPQPSQFCLHEHDLRTSLSQFSPKDVCFGSYDRRQWLVESFGCLYAFLAAVEVGDGVHRSS